MSDPFSGLSGFFFANDPKSASAQDMRRKIALAMIMKKSAAPKTFGEGLYSFGDSISDALMSRNAIAQAQAASEQADKQIQALDKGMTPGVISGTAVPGPRAEVDTEDTEAVPAQQVAAVAPAAVVRAPPDGADPWTARSAGIAGIESGGAKDPYSLIGARTRTGDRAIGKYQIMGANVPQWTAAALGQPMTPEQFRASPDAQEAVFKHRFGQYVDKYGEEGAARAWYAGEGGMKNPNATDVHGRLTVAGYGGDYLKRLAAAGGNPAAAAAAPQVAAAAPTSANAPITPADIAQEERVADVVGMNRGPTNASFAYPQTASRTGDVISDAPQPGITGAPNGPMRDAIADTLQQRQQALQPPQPPTPPPPGPQLAQANVFPQPTVAADGRVAPIIPGGGLPPAPQPAIPAAPPDPRGAIRAAPQVEDYVPPDRPMPQPPRKPGPGPVEQRLLPVLSSDVDDRVKKAAELRIQQERAASAAIYDEEVKKTDIAKQEWLDERRQRTQAMIGRSKSVLEAEKLRRELEGEGATPLTLDQRKSFGIPEGQSAYLTRRGEIKFGPAGTKVEVNTGDKAQGKGDEKLQEKLSESFIKTFEEGNTAGDEIKQLTEMRALAARVGTGAGAVAKQYLGQWGIKTEGLSEIQALQAGINRLIPAQRVPGTGGTSDFEGQMFKDAVVGLSKTPEGNNLIFDTMDGLAKNKLARADVAGRVISGEITRQDGVKEMLGLQREAKDLSDRVKDHLKATGQDKSVAPAVPQQVQDDQAREWLKNNPNHPRAGAVRQKLGM